MYSKMLRNSLLVLIALLSTLVFAACGETPTASPALTTVPVNTAVSTVTTPAVVATNVASVPPVATSTISAVSAGPGSELVGQIFAVGDNDVRVRSVRQFSELRGAIRKAVVMPKGVFMVIDFDVANLGTKPSDLSGLFLKDGQNRMVEMTNDTDAFDAVMAMPQYKVRRTVNPGFIGIDLYIYDVPKDATGFKFEVDVFGYPDNKRTPSAESFSVNGGKGPDSGAGKELIGKTFTNEAKLSITITAVDRLTEIKARNEKFKADGVYLLVQYNVVNNGDKPEFSDRFYLKDNRGYYFAPNNNFDLIIELSMSRKYEDYSNIKPGQMGKSYKVFEVTKEASGFEMTDVNY